MLILLKRFKLWWSNQPRTMQVLWLLLMIGWLVLLFLAVRPFGRATYYFDNQVGHYFIHKIGPKERWSDHGDNLIMIGQPGYFFLRPTRRYNQAKITVDWRPRADETYLAAGVLMDKANWQYQTKLINHSGLNNLTWPVLSGGDYSLWQKQSVYQTWQQFTDNPPDLSRLAVYNWSSSDLNFSQPENYQAGQVWQDIPGQWRGIQQIIVYLSNDEPLAWDLTVTSDALKDLTATERLIEVNITDSSNQRLWSDQRNLIGDRLDWPILAGPWSAGVYRLEIKASSKILIDLSTKQSVFSWQGQVWPVADPDFLWTIWTDAPKITAQTIEPASRQAIKFGQTKLDIDKTYQQYELAIDQLPIVINLQGGDIQLAGNGYFSLTDEIFNPYPRRADRFLINRLTELDFVVAEYQLPDCNQSFCRSSIVLPLSGANWQAGDGYQFILSAEDSQLSTSSPLIIKKIKIELQGNNLLQSVSSLLSRLKTKLIMLL